MGLPKFLQEELYVPFLHWLDSMEDRRRKVKTQQNYELSTLGISSQLGNRYQPLGYGRLKKVLRLARLINPNSTFIDVGCGLGRPILLALELGFSKAIGIDISDKLINLCNQNISKVKDNVTLRCCDIENYSFPNGSLTIFLFNPFDGSRLENLLSKLKKNNCSGLIIYFNPKYHDLFKEKQLLRTLKWKNFGLFEERCNFYRF